MKTINIEGISFTEEMIKKMQFWFVPASEEDKPLVCESLKQLDETQGFLLRNWDSLDMKGEDLKVKSLLKGLQDIKDNLSVFSEIKKGGIR